MNSTWSALLWKEWREHRLVVALLVGGLTATPLVASLWWGADHFFAAASTALMALPVVGMFLAMNIAAREQSTGTIRFLQALPTAGARPAAAKLVAACAAIVIPVASVVAAAWLWEWLYDDYLIIQVAIETDLDTFGNFAGLENWYAARFLNATILGVSLLLWMAAAGVNRSDEVRAAAIGLLVVLCVWGALMLIGHFADRPETHELTWLGFGILLAIAPGGLAVAPTVVTNPVFGWILVLAAVVSHAALAAWFIMRFGRVAAGRMQEVAVDAAAPREDRYWLAPPRRSPLSAIAWKQFRESAPLAALGGGSIVALTLIIAWSVRVADKPLAPDELLGMAGGVWMMVAVGVSIVAGIGIFMEDLRPGINGFWRSRPINVDLWFAVKFAAGLAVTLISLAAGAAVVGAFLFTTYDFDELLPNASRGNLNEGLGICLLVLFQIGLFTAAVAMMALLRQPVYAVAATIASVAIPVSVFAVIAVSEFAAVAIVAALVVSAGVLAWQAVRRDWGWKR